MHMSLIEALIAVAAKDGFPSLDDPKVRRIRDGMKFAPKPSKPARLDILAKERKLPPFLCRSF